MTCSEIQELFGDYVDAPENDPIREKVKRHIADCADCAAELDLWEESVSLIRTTREHVIPVQAPAPIASRVMNRIYESESWRIPVADRMYSIPFKLRRNLTAVIAFCLSLFLISFLYSIVDDHTKEATPYGFIPAASASGSIANSSLTVQSMPKATLASATLIKPMSIGLGKSSPDYFLVLSLLGMIATLLIMNWLSRTRS